MIKILGLDPGKTTGWATITVKEKEIKLGLFGQTKDMTLQEIQEWFDWADTVVYEGFWIRPNKAMAGNFNWDEMPAIQVIGSINTLAGQNQVKTVVKQQPSDKVPGYSFAGMKYVKGKSGTHWQDSLAHCVFYAVKRLGANPVRKN